MKTSKKTLAGLTLVAGLAITGTALGAATTTIGFDGGDDGDFTGNAFFVSNGGNPGGHARHLVSAFGLSLRTGGVAEPANPDFLGDYSSFGAVTFSFDVKVDSLTDFIGNEITRSIGISLFDRDIQGPNGASGIFFELDVLSVFAQPDWVTLSVTIDDTTQTELPAGWIGFGDDDPNTFEPILPDGATFASVLAGVDQFEITSFVPGFFYTDANFNVRIDNVSVTVQPVPVPGALLLFAPALALIAGMRRR